MRRVADLEEAGAAVEDWSAEKLALAVMMLSPSAELSSYNRAGHDLLSVMAGVV